MRNRIDRKTLQPTATVAIVGRPNVGKSSLFNLLAGRRISIVDAHAGVTRDRVSTVMEAGKHVFELVDTGGMGFSDEDTLTEDVAGQIQFALEAADVVVFVVDAQEGIMPLDQDVAGQLRHLGKPVILVANKADNPALEAQAGQFYALGFGEPLATSVAHTAGGAALLERIAEEVGAVAGGKPADGSVGEGGPLRLAIVGKRNAGKSTLLNLLVGGNRQIVSELPGTTRDSVDVPVTIDSHDYVLIDTAGVVRKRGISDSVSFYTQVRTEGAVRRSDVVLFMLDATTEISQVDKKITHYIVEHYKPVVIVINKWDLAGDATMGGFRRYIEGKLAGLSFAPIVAASARTGFNMHEVLAVARDLHSQARARVTTHEINEILSDAFARRSPKPTSNRIGKLRYATQARVAPPTVVLFVNEPKLFSGSYARYLQNRLRKTCPYAEVPIRIEFRASGRRSDGR